MVKKAEAFTALRKAFQILFILAFLLGLAPAGVPAQARQISGLPEALETTRKKVYVPLIQSAGQLPLMAGIMGGWPGQAAVDQVMKPLDTWVTGVAGGRSTSIFATFLPLDLKIEKVKANVEDPLTVVWNAGYTPFINLPTINGNTALDVATSSKYEYLITNWAKSFKNYANGGKRFAYFAPMQEMNSNWVTYGGNPTNFKRAYKRFQDIFAQVGVPAHSVKWVFAPNGWTDPRTPMFEEYYPGDAFVDVVAMSAYNFGYCNGNSWVQPEYVFNDPSFDYGYYLDRLQALAPSKPIFIAQTATSSYTAAGVKNPAEKDRWLRDAYQYLSTKKNVRAVIYFNDPNSSTCDWAIFNGATRYSGYKTGINDNGYRYIAPASLLTTDHTVQ